MSSKLAVPVIDLFAGPGGLREGFSRYSEFFADKSVQFNVKLSIEKDRVSNPNDEFERAGASTFELLKSSQGNAGASCQIGLRNIGSQPCRPCTVCDVAAFFQRRAKCNGQYSIR